MQLSPRENFTIVRQIEDHTDSATYYVRAVIRNAKTDAIIAVSGNNYVNLTDRGSQRFSKEWLVSADPSGQGFYISILTSVYTDSGYTTKSQNYGDKMDVYLIQDRFNQNLGGVGGGGADIDYKKIRNIVNDVVSEKIKEIQPPVINVPNAPEAKIIEVIKEVVVKVPTTVDLLPVLTAIKNIPQFPEISKVDLTPVIDRLDGITSQMRIMPYRTAKMQKTRQNEPQELDLPVSSPYDERTNKIIKTLKGRDIRTVNLLK